MGAGSAHSGASRGLQDPEGLPVMCMHCLLSLSWERPWPWAHTSTGPLHLAPDRQRVSEMKGPWCGGGGGKRGSMVTLRGRRASQASRSRRACSGVGGSSDDRLGAALVRRAGACPRRPVTQISLLRPEASCVPQAVRGAVSWGGDQEVWSWDLESFLGETRGKLQRQCGVWTR